MACREFPPQRSEMENAKSDRHVDPERAGRFARARREFGLGRLDAGEQFLAARIKPFALVGQ